SAHAADGTTGVAPPPRSAVALAAPAGGVAGLGGRVDRPELVATRPDVGDLGAAALIGRGSAGGAAGTRRDRRRRVPAAPRRPAVLLARRYRAAQSSTSLSK